MSEKKILHAAMNAFKQKFSEFCQNEPDVTTDGLSPEAMARLTRGLMDAAQSAGQSGLREYLHLHDDHTQTVTLEEKTYRYKNHIDKDLLTLFGTITVSRAVYGNDLLGGYVVPLDRAIGIHSGETATLEAREMILFASSSATPDEVAKLLGKASLCRPSRSAIQSIIVRDGSRMEQHHEAIAHQVCQSQEVPEEAQVLVASMDGANVRLREAGAKKGRKPQRPRNEYDDTTRSSFRNAMVGSLSWYGLDDQGHPLRLDSTYVARMPEDKAPTFKRQFEQTLVDLTTKADTAGRCVEKVLLCDGHRAIWNYADHCDLLADFHFCVDFYHTAEHLSKAAEAIFGAKSPRGHWWYDRWRHELKNTADAPRSIIRSIQGYLKRIKLPKTRREALQAELTFFKRNRHLMRYCDFIAKGFPIGSGPVEAAAKTIVKQRMCRSGMRWNRETGQHVLSLRAYAKSKTWERMWQVYTQFCKAA
jgi:hypothetical protein